MIYFLAWIAAGLSAWAYAGWKDHLFRDPIWYLMILNCLLCGPLAWIGVAIARKWS